MALEQDALNLQYLQLVQQLVELQKENVQKRWSKKKNGKTHN